MGIFHFKQFSVDDSRCGMKIGTDAVLLGAWTATEHARTIVDAGCGSGVISLMMAQRSRAEKIIAVDISHEACLDATDNAFRSPWSERVEVVENDVTQFFPVVSHPLLIISNPPFFNEQLHSPDADRALARHGNDFTVTELIAIADRNINHPDDSLAFIAPTGRTDEIEFQLSLHRLTVGRICKVFSREGKESIRTLWQVWRESPSAPSLHRGSLYIRDSDNQFSEAYRKLTTDFYLDK